MTCNFTIKAKGIMNWNIVRKVNHDGYTKCAILATHWDPCCPYPWYSEWTLPPRMARLSYHQRLPPQDASKITCFRWNTDSHFHFHMKSRRITFKLITARMQSIKYNLFHLIQLSLSWAWWAVSLYCVEMGENENLTKAFEWVMILWGCSVHTYNGYPLKLTLHHIL